MNNFLKNISEDFNFNNISDKKFDIVKIIEDFDFNNVNKESDSTHFQNALFNSLFEKILEDTDFSFLDSNERLLYIENINNGCPYKYKVSSHDELHTILQGFEREQNRPFIHSYLTIFYFVLLQIRPTYTSCNYSMSPMQEIEF